MSNGQASYPLPVDYERQIPETHWTRQNRWKMPLIGAQEWEAIKSSYVASTERERIKFEGVKNNQIYIDPTPGAGEDGETLAFYYQSKNWVRPRLWVAGSLYTANEVVWYDGNIYIAATSGTSGATPPTHTSGSASDGNISFTYQTLDVWDSFRADTDVPLLDDQLIGLGLEYKYLRSSGYEYKPAQTAYEEHLARIASDLEGSSIIDASTRRTSYYLAHGTVPDGSWNM